MSVTEDKPSPAPTSGPAAEPLVLTLRESPQIPLEVEAICPDVLAGLSRDEVAAQQVYLGKRRLRLDDLFDIEGDGSEYIELRGDTRQLKWLGRGMTRGVVTVQGSVNMHLGAFMRGGVIDVQGNAADWVGAEMRGGLIRVQGNAGGQIGAAYRGSNTGMRDGMILVGGSAGLEIGMRMKRGIIAVQGPVRDFAGLQMKGGTLFLLSGTELRTGAWMSRGTIVSLKPLPLLPTFSPACTYNPVFLRLYAQRLRMFGIELPPPTVGRWSRHSGDASVPGKGEILIWQPSGA